MEDAIKNVFEAKTIHKFSSSVGGCISSGCGYELDDGRLRLFIKKNKKKGSDVMFKGELASLKAIHETNTILVPKPYEVFNLKDGTYCFATEYVEMSSLTNSAELGRKLADLHLHNRNLIKKKELGELSNENNDSSQIQPVYEFGFHENTCCGFIPQNNEFVKTWPELIARKLNDQISMVESNCRDKEAIRLWSELQLKIPQFFDDVEILPSLLHGDLWSGNASQCSGGPIVFDAACFYGHDEYDLAIASMFGGFDDGFFDEYHKQMARESKVKNNKNMFKKRQELYQLFHYLNHWNHFGGGYKSQSINIMNSLLKM